MGPRAKLMLSSIASSYVARELDSRVYDTLLQTRAGRRVMALGHRQKQAIEFLMYATSAYIVTRQGARTPFRVFLDRIVEDLPAEIAKRFWDSATEKQELLALAYALEKEDVHELGVNTLSSVPPQNIDSDVDWRRMADDINKKRDDMRTSGRRLRSFSWLFRKKN